MGGNDYDHHQHDNLETARPFSGDSKHNRMCICGETAFLCSDGVLELKHIELNLKLIYFDFTAIKH